MGKEAGVDSQRPAEMIKRVYLFDIDGTLVNAGGVGSQAFRDTVRNLLGHDLAWQGRDFAGQTDAGLFRRALSEANRGDELLLPLFEDYHQRLELNLRARPPELLPGVEPLMKAAGIAKVPKARRAVLVGTALSPGQAETKKDGTVIRTLWGHMAWQLGGAPAYQLIAEADAIKVSERDFDRILELLDNPPKPNAKLRAAAAALPKAL